jgi:hypothetical protein
MGKPWKTLENYGKLWENHGKPWNNYEKNHGNSVNGMGFRLDLLRKGEIGEVAMLILSA